VSQPIRPRVLCVDDEPHVLDGLARVLRRDYEIVGVPGGPAALGRLQDDRNFAVIVSDLRMPSLDGIAFITAAARIAPDATRILLTGFADVRSAIRAVNEGHVFRLLTKPCDPEVLRAALEHAVEQHRLVTAERELLERTLHGSVQMLIDLIAITHPVAFGRASRVRRIMGEVAALIGLRDRWQMEMAGMLSQVGVLTLPPALAARDGDGAELQAEEEALVARLPEVALRLIRDIPRLDEVREVLAHINDRFDGPVGEQTVAGAHIPLGARLLRAVLDFDRLCSQGHSASEAVARLRARIGWYDPDVLSDLVAVVGVHGHREVRELRFQEVELGMEFVDDVRAGDGTLLVARGQEVTPSLLERMQDYWSDLELPGPVRVTLVGREPSLKESQALSG
jgi:response regulator RpfG family c-di-GMP phosphodiesterase